MMYFKYNLDIQKNYGSNIFLVTVAAMHKDYNNKTHHMVPIIQFQT